MNELLNELSALMKRCEGMNKKPKRRKKCKQQPEQEPMKMELGRCLDEDGRVSFMSMSKAYPCDEEEEEERQ